MTPPTSSDAEALGEDRRDGHLEPLDPREADRGTDDYERQIDRVWGEQ